MAWAAVIPAAISVAGTVAKAGGQMKGGHASNEAAMYRAAVARQNADLYDQAATRVVQGGEVASDVAGMRTAQTVGGTRAKQAANGIDVNTGSAVEVRAGQAQAGRLDQQTILNNAQLQGYGYRVKAQQERAQANLDVMEGSQATAGAGLSAAGTLLGGASSLPFGWLKGSGGGGDAGSEAARTAGDADLGGYGGNPA